MFFPSVECCLRTGNLFSFHQGAYCCTDIKTSRCEMEDKLNQKRSLPRLTDWKSVMYTRTLKVTSSSLSLMQQRICDCLLQTALTLQQLGPSLSGPEGNGAKTPEKMWLIQFDDAIPLSLFTAFASALKLVRKKTTMSKSKLPLPGYPSVVFLLWINYIYLFIFFVSAEMKT